MNGEKHQFWTCLGVLAVMLPGIAIQARADAPWIYGIHWYGSSGSTDVEAMSGGKGLWVLENVNTWSSPSASGQKSKFATEVARGHSIIVRLQPRWGWAVPTEAEMDAYLDAVRDVAETLKNEVHIWQIGNEMNNPGEYGGMNLSAADYVSRFKRIRDVIHEVQSPLGPQMVLLGPTSSFALGYQISMLLLLDPQDVDGFAIHAYGLDPNFDPEPIAINSVNNFAAAVQEHTEVIDQFGFPYKPVWITEFDRCSSPQTDAQEAVSAQFLHMAYDWLAGWNANPSNHPVMSAMWFVYPDDSNWGCYSILNFKGGPSGPNADLWDAFAFAAGKNYASPSLVQAMETGPSAFAREITYGEDPSDDAIEITNLGAGAMVYTLSESVAWLSVTPSTGTSYFETDSVAVNYDLSSLLPGSYDTTIQIEAPGAVNGSATVNVSIRIKPYPGDMDGDFDCDMDDFAFFQSCMSGTGAPSTAPNCDLASLDGDIDVDVNDLGLFLGCMSGANLPMAPDCVP